MAFTFQDLQGSQAADINQVLRQLTGYGFVEGGEPYEGGLPFAVDVQAATTYIDGQEVSTDATSINLMEARDYIDYDAIPNAEERFGDYEVKGFEKPHKLIIYIGADGEFHVYPGEPATAEPRGRFRFETFQPSPPDFREMLGVPVAEVWVGAFTQHITDEDIRDRRLNAQMDSRLLTVDTLDFDELIDGSGATKTELVEAADAFDTQDIRDVINSDTAHGTDASHTYHSGSHDDLTAVAQDDHHTRYPDSEAVAAVDGKVDLATLTGSDDVTPGYHLAVGDGELTWENPPMAEAPVLDSGTITHTGGDTTTATITGISPTETAQFELMTAVGVDTSPSWSADYAYSVETSYHWNDAAKEITAIITLGWETDPGSGNDLTLQYNVYEMTPEKVSSLYDDDLAAQAMTGESLSLTEAGVALSLSPPVYDAPEDAPSPTAGDLIVSTDPDSSEFGEFVYDGSQWTGPYTAGVTALSDLSIDTAKDWGGYTIGDVGLPQSSTSALREEDIADHAASEDAHHTKTTSSDIDHSSVSNVQADQHHTQYTDAEAAEAIGVQEKSPTISATAIPDGGVVRVHTRIADGEQLRLLRGEVMDEDGQAPSGLTLQIGDAATGDVHYIQSSRHFEGSPDTPLTTIDGPMTLDIHISNTTGQTVAAGGSVSYWLDQSG